MNSLQYICSLRIMYFLSVCKFSTAAMYFDNKSHSTAIQGVSLSSYVLCNFECFL